MVRWGAEVSAGPGTASSTVAVFLSDASDRTRLTASDTTAAGSPQPSALSHPGLARQERGGEPGPTWS